ncbi:hypothetical protein TrCOL_g1596 [Triparma columacea]|uniref:Uncharacterized protein n=2 Tax=Triparma columacea TaxID=722753 RepID=A0A9W7LD90_9STRA|nr:hypothetical protein TrCOL_g1596 [Triparma columacea]
MDKAHAQLQLISQVLNTSGLAVALWRNARAIRYLSERGEVTRRTLFEFEGLVKGLVRVMGKEGAKFGVARLWAAKAIAEISRIDEVTKEDNDNLLRGMFEYEGLLDCLAQTMRKEEGETRLWAVSIVEHISCGDPRLRQGLFEHEGVVAGVVKVLLEERGMEEQTIAITALIKILGLVTLTDTNILDRGGGYLKNGTLLEKAKFVHHGDLLVDRLVRELKKEGEAHKIERASLLATIVAYPRMLWQIDRHTLEATSLMLKLCKSKMKTNPMRATPNAGTRVGKVMVFLDKYEDVAEHILSFLEWSVTDFFHSRKEDLLAVALESGEMRQRNMCLFWDLA